MKRRASQERSKDAQRRVAKSLCLLLPKLFLFSMLTVALLESFAGCGISTAIATSNTDDAYNVSLLVREDFCYGVILTPGNRTTGFEETRFTFTYNLSHPLASRYELHNYTILGDLKPPKEDLRVSYDTRGYYCVNRSNSCICRLYDLGTTTQLGVEYAKVCATTMVTNGSASIVWFSGYTIGSGAIAIVKHDGSGTIEGGSLDVGTLVALTITSLLPFFLLLPDATKRLCSSIDEAAGEGSPSRMSDRTRRLYARILAILTPLLCIGIAFLSIDAALSALGAG